MQKKRMSIDFDLRFQELTDLNPSFAKAKIAICYPGRNRNMSDISKEVLISALDSLKNCPVVGRYDAEKDDFGGHDVRILRDKETGEWVAENATVPFGTVPESSVMEFKDVTELDGTIREYLFSDVILWKRQPGFECIAKNQKLGHSMEILVNSYMVDNDGYCVIEDMDFEALCILGSDVTPCFESSSIEMMNSYAIDNFKSQFSAMLKELKDITADNTDGNDSAISKKGGNGLEKFNHILQELGLTVEQITFEITDDMTEDEFRNKAKELIEIPKAPINKDDEPQISFESKYTTYNQKRDALRNALDPVIVKNGNGDTISSTYYWLMDFDDTYVLVERYLYTANDETTDHGRFEYTFNETNVFAEITSEFEPMILTWLTVDEHNKLEQSRNAFATLQTEFDKYKQEHSVSDSDVEELKQFKQAKLKAEHEQLVDEVLEEFDDLGEIQEFIELKEKAYDYQIDTLRNECYIIRGKNIQPKHIKNEKSSFTKLPVGQPEEAEPYGGIFNMYKNKKS